ncbi:hypothetical protein Aglo03_34500 [Actinokineospora globicatena]|uniref:Uncharacterized protein n=1 Tax=Actinokineospora globicatena TaxID=103729 RepID=A0A9W6QQ87_9PSEU|nr:hypothetical protein Aglo03_34500 [Actinokineospora globicatena]
MHRPQAPVVDVVAEGWARWTTHDRAGDGDTAQFRDAVPLACTTSASTPERGRTLLSDLPPGAVNVHRFGQFRPLTRLRWRQFDPHRDEVMGNSDTRPQHHIHTLDESH